MNGRSNILPISVAEQCCPPPTTDELMWALINITAQIAGMGTPLTCSQVLALSANYNCIPRSEQLPALIALNAQIAANAGTQIPGPRGPQGPPGDNGGSQGIYEVNVGGYPNLPTFTPAGPAAINIDPDDGNNSQYYNGAWH